MPRFKDKYLVSKRAETSQFFRNLHEQAREVGNITRYTLTFFNIARLSIHRIVSFSKHFLQKKNISPIPNNFFERFARFSQETFYLPEARRFARAKNQACRATIRAEITVAKSDSAGMVVDIVTISNHDSLLDYQGCKIKIEY